MLDRMMRDQLNRERIDSGESKDRRDATVMDLPMQDGGLPAKQKKEEAGQVVPPPKFPFRGMSG